MAFCFTNLAPGSAVIADLPQLHDGMQAVWHFFETGGWYMVPILICSLVAVMVVFMKFIDLRRSFIAPVELDRKLSEVEDLVATGRLEEISQSLRRHDSVLARISRHALLPTHGSKEEAEKSTETLAREEISRLERGIPLLEVIFTIAPLLGLIGTVSGMVHIFGSFGAKAAGPEQAMLISRGISEALNTTIAGLVVAVPCYIFQSYFSRKLEGLALRMATLTTGLIQAAYRPLEAPPVVTESAPVADSHPKSTGDDETEEMMGAPERA